MPFVCLGEEKCHDFYISWHLESPGIALDWIWSSSAAKSSDMFVAGKKFSQAIYTLEDERLEPTAITHEKKGK